MITFGLAQSREKKTEKYDFPVLTMGIDKGEGTSRKFYFNKAAVDQLGLTDTSTVCFAKTANGIAIVNCSALDVALVPERIRREIKKTDMSISTRPDYDKVTKMFGLDTTAENEFKLEMNAELVPNTAAADLFLLGEDEEVATEVDAEVEALLGAEDTPDTAEVTQDSGVASPEDYTRPSIF